MNRTPTGPTYASPGFCSPFARGYRDSDTILSEEGQEMQALILILSEVVTTLKLLDR